jgi:hypothetical protein
VISGPYTIRSVKMTKMSFSSRPIRDKIITCGYRVLTFKKCTTVMIAELAVTSSLRSFFD